MFHSMSLQQAFSSEGYLLGMIAMIERCRAQLWPNQSVDQYLWLINMLVYSLVMSTLCDLCIQIRHL